jgi:Carboxypeptidase regulatory-like domain
MKRSVPLFGFVLALALALPSAAQAPTGAIAGTVTDANGGILPNATITVTNQGTGASRILQSGPDGTFSVPSLPAGRYDVVVAAQGFQPTNSPADVVTGSTTTVRVNLELGTRSETITVTGAARSARRSPRRTSCPTTTTCIRR